MRHLVYAGKWILTFAGKTPRACCNLNSPCFGVWPPRCITRPRSIGIETLTRTAISRLSLTDFRNYTATTLRCDTNSVVLLGLNGEGKTNCLEALSLLTAGRGLRGVPFPDLARFGGPGGWAVSASLTNGDEETQVGTRLELPLSGALTVRSGRTVKIDGTLSKGSGGLAFVRLLWLTPGMDSLFTGPASERRRFMDRLVISLEPAYATQAAAFDRAMRQRNKALEIWTSPVAMDAIEVQLATAGAAVASARHRTFSLLRDEISERSRSERLVVISLGRCQVGR